MLHLADAFLHLWRSSVSTDWRACEYACTQMSRPTAPRANQSASPMLRLLPSHTGRPPPMTRMRRRLRSLGSRGSGVGSRVSRERAVSRQMEYGLRGRSFQDRRAAALAPSTQERLDVRDMPMRRDDQTEERAKRSCTAGGEQRTTTKEACQTRHRTWNCNGRTTTLGISSCCARFGPTATAFSRDT